MLLCMRTTLNIDEHIYRAAKIKAAQEGKTLTRIVEKALSEHLNPAKQEKPFRPRWVIERG